MIWEQEHQLREELAKLKADNAWLRGLLKRLEFADSTTPGWACFFCGSRDVDQHVSNCPVFTPGGEVK